MKIIIISGYFNPLHTGHLKMIDDASQSGGLVYAIVNTDNQVKLKGSVPFFKQKDRVEIMKHIWNVDEVYLSIDKDKTVCKTIEKIVRESKDCFKGEDIEFIFVNGGDKKLMRDIPEATICKQLKVKMRFNYGGRKTLSSSTLISNAAKEYARKK